MDIVLSLISNILLSFGAILIIEKTIKCMLEKKVYILVSLLSGVVLTLMIFFSLPSYVVAAVFAVCVSLLFANTRRMSFFLAFNITVGILFYDFFISSILAIYTGNLEFTNPYYIINLIVAIVFRLVLVIIGLNYYKIKKDYFNITTILGLIALIFFAEKISDVYGNDDIFFTWLILYIIFIGGTQVYRINILYENEKLAKMLLEEQEELLQREIHIIDETYNVNRELYHDMHNHIVILKDHLAKGELGQAKDYLDEVYAPISKIIKTSYTGNKSVDYLLSHKIDIANSKGITVSVNAEFPINTSIVISDLCAILGNMLDNAIRGNENVKQKIIDVKIRRINDMLIIKVVNPTCDELSHDDFSTTKDDKSLHGIGLKSIDRLAHKYDGDMRVSYEDGLFINTVTLSYSAVLKN